MAFKGNTPEQGTAQWKRNESIIARNPTLRAARDTSEGFRPGSGISTSQQQVTDAYKDGWDRIWGKKGDQNAGDQ